jgi:hypothetical protein
MKYPSDAWIIQHSSCAFDAYASDSNSVNNAFYFLCLLRILYRYLYCLAISSSLGALELCLVLAHNQISRVKFIISY